MNDKPNVLKLDVSEWKALSVQSVGRLADGINSLVDYLSKQQVINQQIVSEIDQHWALFKTQIDNHWTDVVRSRLKGWEQHSRPIIAEHEARQAAEAQSRVQEPPEIFNGPHGRTDLSLTEREAIAAKKKGGWPKGKKRAPKSNASAAVLPPVTQ